MSSGDAELYHYPQWASSASSELHESVALVQRERKIRFSLEQKEFPGWERTVTATLPKGLNKSFCKPSLKGLVVGAHALRTLHLRKSVCHTQSVEP